MMEGEKSCVNYANASELREEIEKNVWGGMIVYIWLDETRLGMSATLPAALAVLVKRFFAGAVVVCGVAVSSLYSKLVDWFCRV